MRSRLPPHRWIVAIACLVATTSLSGRQSVGGGPGRMPPPPGPVAPQPTGTGAISGVVIDGATSRPIAGAVVYLGIQGRGPVGQQSRQVTDPKGRFVFTDLPASDLFFMNANKAGYQDGRYGDTGPVSSGIASGLIRLTDGQWFSTVTIPLWRPGVIGGVVRDERGDPMVGVHVRALSQITVAGLPHLAAGAITRTDDRGRYRLAGLTPGKYIVSVPSVQSSVPVTTSAMEIEGQTPQSASQTPDAASRRNNGALQLDPGHLLIVGNFATPPGGAVAQAYPITFHPGTPTLSGAAAIELSEGETREGVDVSVRPVSVVRVSGRIDGPPEATRGLVLRLIAAGLEDLGEGSEVATALVGAGGQFMLLNVPAGEYTLSASRSTLEYGHGPTRGLALNSLPGTPGLVPGPGTYLGGLTSGPPGSRVSGTHGAGDVGFWARVPVAVGQTDVTGVTVTMRRAVTMRGRIAFEGDGNPPGNTSVIAEPADGNPLLGLQHGTTRPAPGDEFTIAGLMPGEYVLRVIGLSPRHAVKSIVAGSIDYTTRPFDAGAGQDFDDVVVTYTDRIATIAGTIPSDANSTRPLTVIAFPEPREQWTRYGLSAQRFKTVPVTSSGTYKIENIPAGTYLLVVVDTSQSRRWQDPAFLDAAAKVATRATVGWGETQTQDLRVSVIK